MNDAESDATPHATSKTHSWKPAINEKIAIIKDIAAAGVGVAMWAWLLALGFEVAEMLPLSR
jgi:hypothetical protein